MNYFEKLNQVDVSEHIEKKGNFNYLSWAWAVETLGKLHPEAIIDTKTDEEGFPAFYSQDGQAMVWVTVEIEGVKRGQPFPVFEMVKGKGAVPTDNPSVTQINNALQRALVKAISLHGLGLYIYAGEDLPIDRPPYTAEQKKTFDELIDEESEPLEFWIYLQTLPDETKIALHNSFDKGTITARKKKAGSMETAGSAMFSEYVKDMINHIEAEDIAGLHELGLELGKQGKVLAFRQLTPAQQHKAEALKQ